MTRLEGRGHAIVDHTADQIVEAWGATRAACLEEAAHGLLEAVVSLTTGAVSQTTAVTFDGADHTRLLLALLEEVIFLLDTADAVPVRVRVDDHGGSVEVRFDLAELDGTEPTGTAPKGISHSGLDLSSDGRRWTARALIDL